MVIVHCYVSLPEGKLRLGWVGRSHATLEKVNGFREEVARLVDECQKDQVGELLDSALGFFSTWKTPETSYFQLPITEKLLLSYVFGRFFG